MKIVVAIDSFKGSLTSLQAGQAVKEAILRLDDAAEQRNPLETTTYGVGELIRDAVKRGCQAGKAVRQKSYRFFRLRHRRCRGL